MSRCRVCSGARYCRHIKKYQRILLFTGACPRVIVDDLRYVESIEIQDRCNTKLERWDITLALNTKLSYGLSGHCYGCSKETPDCYVERRTNGLYQSQGQCSGTDCSKQDDEKWMTAAHADCSRILGCSARCQIPPKCSGGCCHDFWRCVPESDEKTSVACDVRSESAADAQGIQAACMKLKNDRTSVGATILSNLFTCCLYLHLMAFVAHLCRSMYSSWHIPTRMHLPHLYRQPVRA